MVIKVKLLLLFSLLVPMAAHSAVTLDWNQLVQKTESENPELKASQSGLTASEYQARAAASGFFPDISGNLGYSYGTGNSTTPGTVNPSIGGGGSASSNYTASLTAKQNLFAGLLDLGKMNQARANREVADAALSTAKAKVSYDLRSAAANLSYAQKAIVLTNEIIRRRESNLKLVELRFESGRENKGSVMLSRAYLEQARLDGLQSENALDVARAQIARVVGSETVEEWTFEGAIPIQSPVVGTDLKALVLLTPDYRTSVAQEASADAAFTIARSNLLPSLSVTGSETNTGRNFFPSNNRWSVGVALTVPLFSGGKDYYATKSANEQYRAASLTRQNALRTGLAKLKQSWASYREAVQKLEVDRNFSGAAEIRARISREKYNNGLLSFEDWDVIENDLISRQKSFLQSERDRVVAEGAWEQAQGKGVIR